MKFALLVFTILVISSGMASGRKTESQWSVEDRWIQYVANPKPAQVEHPSERKNDLTIGAWQLYRSIFMADGGRIVDRENGAISHSEGQGYGMLIAATLGDREAFDRLWDWTERELLVRDDSLAAWKWDPSADPHVSDMNNATDGDLLIAWALLRAYKKWNVRDYLREAEAIVDDIVSKATIVTPYGSVLLPGTKGFSGKDRPDGPVVNLSYWVFPAIEELAAQMPVLAKSNLGESGMRLLRDVIVSGKTLPSEWTALGGDDPVSADGFEPVFGYNALRIPLYVAWSQKPDPQLLEALATAWSGGGEAGLDIIDVKTRTAVEPIRGRGYGAIHELTLCSLGHHTNLTSTETFEPSTYYSSTLQLLTLIAFSERYSQCP
ncbi:glycosyl hydrolase family 8 [Fulvimarina sp. 2208YS6-2-32]|uniref:Glucanase n=1 Tax=Fulvimarina uroteuthidis TaxID=3098149 RepID=A0ABU5I6U1_9HYPH|nr:glycosyl hydrolase family 8 [Fulvimarina sp. 2208YS6-2-32]MDY8110802.1 glycosyl hydrolase family 8 [Fulvimarina sp. 2208YS6-2-32]